MQKGTNSALLQENWKQRRIQQVLDKVPRVASSPQKNLPPPSPPLCPPPSEACQQEAIS